MANFTPLSSSFSDTPLVSAAAAAAASSSSSSSSFGAGVDEAFEDEACSICLDPFTTQDPPTVTCCNHEYHLQCILEWSQRSKECPICWRLLVLKDHASQELLAAVETERRLRSRNLTPASMVAPHLDDDYDVEQDSYSDDSDFDEHIMQHLAAAATSRARHQTYTSPEEGQASSYGSSVINSPTPDTLSVNIQNLSSVAPPDVNQVSTTAANSPFQTQRILLQWISLAYFLLILFRPPPTDTEGQGSSEVLSLSDSIKSKWFAASSRYKESLSKGTRGIKEKLVARNNSVKELSKEVQREMSAGIAGVARMIERLDLTSKRTGPSMSDSGLTGGTSNFSWKGKGVEQNIIAQALDQKK
ncbi:E3 UBIQUITIN-PROTEIN LIGASE RHF1A [Salix purpurea]|uniref:RING-type E3 ubiquitin transferase n=1 Tax=Salix purpurea TaxID=77065 RepID=A0A9Q0TWV3_SALPP|nr:E3 UBIQUITIN-PROTEIN LIGASE RHF1A [Salix purpurea]